VPVRVLVNRCVSFRETHAAQDAEGGKSYEESTWGRGRAGMFLDSDTAYLEDSSAVQEKDCRLRVREARSPPGVTQRKGKTIVW